MRSSSSSSKSTKRHNFQDDELWELFKEDFNSFTEQIFKSCSPTWTRRLRILLRAHGVWINKGRNTTVPKALHQTVIEDQPVKWTDFEINEHLFSGGTFNSGQIAYRLRIGQNQHPSPPVFQTPIQHENVTWTPAMPPVVPTPLFQTPIQHENITRTPTTPPMMPIPLAPAVTTQGHGRELSNLVKMYTDESKYSGENDNFDRNPQYPAHTHPRSGPSVPQPGLSSAPPPGPSVPQGFSILPNPLQNVPLVNQNAPPMLPIAPPQVAPAAQGYGRKLSNLAKMYTEESKYSGLVKKDVFEIIDMADVPKGVRIFNSRFVDEIKNVSTDKAFEKSRLVVQAYNDYGKDLVLTQSPTLQIMSQRLILAIAATLQGNR